MLSLLLPDGDACLNQISLSPRRFCFYCTADQHGLGNPYSIFQPE